MTTLEELEALDAALASAGHHPLTPWWREQLRRFYAHPTARTFVGRVGRGGAKSHTSVKVGLAETLYGDWKIPPGERHYWAYVSANKEEAFQRLTLLKSGLDRLGFKYEAEGDAIDLVDYPRGFRVFACQVGAVSGFRCYGYSADELAKWRAGVEFASPAQEVVTSLDAMTVTHAAEARRLLISSPFSTVDYHAERFDLGDTDEQLVATAPTWVANPSVTEADTRKLARHNERLWRREYAAVPDQALGAALEGEHVDRAFQSHLPPMLVRDAICALDPSQLRGDAFYALFAYFCEPLRERIPKLDRNGMQLRERVEVAPGFVAEVPVFYESAAKPVIRIEKIVAWNERGGADRPVPSLEEIVGWIGAECRARGIQKCVSDQCVFGPISGWLSKHGVRFKEYHWSQASKESAVTLLNDMFRSGGISITTQGEGSAVMRRELHAIKARATAGGTWHYDTNGKDAASALITLAHALGDPEMLGVSTPNIHLDVPGARAPNYRHLAPPHT